MRSFESGDPSWPNQGPRWSGPRLGWRVDPAGEHIQGVGWLVCFGFIYFFVFPLNMAASLNRTPHTTSNVNCTNLTVSLSLSPAGEGNPRILELGPPLGEPLGPFGSVWCLSFLSDGPGELCGRSIFPAAQHSCPHPESATPQIVACVRAGSARPKAAEVTRNSLSENFLQPRRPIRCTHRGLLTLQSVKQQGQGEIWGLGIV